MTIEQWTAVDDYLNGMLVPPDPVLEQTLRSGAAAGLPRIDVAPNQGKLLHLLARISGAQRVLEIGTLAGYSAIWLGRALPPDGHLLTLEINPEHARVANANLANAGLTGQVEVRVGPAMDTLAELAEAGADPFDLVFVDADKAALPDYFTACLRLSRPGTVLVFDNVVRKGAVADPDTTDPNVQGVRRLYKLIAAEPRVVATAVQTVGGKGYDGLAVALVV